MELVVFDGVSYEKASTLAKKFKYTSDYIGQLCRTKKIDARLIGRTWFVNPESLQEYRHNKKHKSLARKKLKDNAVMASKSNPFKKKAVLPVMQNKTAKAAVNVAIMAGGVKTRKLSVAYEPDDEMLIPKLKKKKVRAPQTVRIDQVDASRVSVKGGHSSATFQASELPEVSLSGELKIGSFPDSPPEEVSEIPAGLPVAEKDLLNKNDEKPIEPLKIKVDKPKNNSNLPVAMTRSAVSNKPKIKVSPLTTASTSKTTVEPPALVTDTPTTQVMALNTVEAKQQAKKPVPRPSFLLLASPLIATVLALLTVSLIFSASSKIVVSDSVYDSQIIFHINNFLDMLTRNF